MSKYTPWFSHKRPPARNGWYECRYAWDVGAPVMQYWGGERWSASPGWIRCSFGELPWDVWRGLAKEPK